MPGSWRKVADRRWQGCSLSRLATFDSLASLPVEIDGYSLEGLEANGSSEFTRLSTVIRISGGGEGGVGEDVTYDALDHVALQDAGPVLDLAGKRTVGEFCELVGGLDLFPAEPVRDVSRRYRRWAFESAALDLALRQARRPLHEVVGREMRPLNFVVSLRLGDPPTIDPVRRRLDLYPTLRFKLDPTDQWTEALIAELVETGCAGWRNCAPPTTAARSAPLALTAAASSSSGRDAARSSTWPRSSIRTRRTTSRRRRTTCPTPSRACLRALWSRSRRPPASAGV